MIYRNFQNEKLSILGFGAMRLPHINDDDSMVDSAEVEKMVDYAMKSGVNYYDTAWGYHDGNSEIVLGKALEKYPRTGYYLADKFPGYDLNNMPRVREIFEKQLHKCSTNYFDFYLFHNVCEMNINAYLNPKFGIANYLIEQKRLGRIRHLGFSAHGSVSVMERFLKAYGKHMEFCQIQLNYLDWSFQGAEEKVKLLNDWKIPIWVMEPLRGGRLAKLSEKDEKILKSYRPTEEIPAWAFRFLQGVPGVTVILSGMSNMEQLKANIQTLESEKPLSEEEKNTLFSIANGLLDHKIPCTSCRYCVSHCPKKLDIPGLLSLYNEHTFTGGGFIAPMALSALPDEKQPSACLSCHSCEKVCPQGIKIADIMSDFALQML